MAYRGTRKDYYTADEIVKNHSIILETLVLDFVGIERIFNNYLRGSYAVYNVFNDIRPPQYFKWRGALTLQEYEKTGKRTRIFGVDLVQFASGEKSEQPQSS